MKGVLVWKWIITITKESIIIQTTTARYESEEVSPREKSRWMSRREGNAGTKVKHNEKTGPKMQLQRVIITRHDGRAYTWHLFQIHSIMRSLLSKGALCLRGSLGLSMKWKHETTFIIELAPIFAIFTTWPDNQSNRRLIYRRQLV